MTAKLRNWTPSQRQEQSAKIRAQKIWLKSTGPKTLEGKKRSSRNAVKNGMRSRETLCFKEFLRLQNKLLQKYKEAERIGRIKRRYVFAMLELGYDETNFKNFHKRTQSLGCFDGQSGDPGPPLPQKSCHPPESRDKR